MEESISHAKQSLAGACQRIGQALANTPDDRLNWSPSPTARTPLQVAAHAAMVVQAIPMMFQGQPWPYKDTNEADAAFRQNEAHFSTREQVLTALRDNEKIHQDWLDNVTPDQLASTVSSPFGDMPMTVAIMLGAYHTQNHCAQIDYIQTIYGDRDWHN